MVTFLSIANTPRMLRNLPVEHQSQQKLVSDNIHVQHLASKIAGLNAPAVTAQIAAPTEPTKAPKTDVPKTDVPKTDVSKTDAPKITTPYLAKLVGRAVLPATTFANGPVSGQFLTLNNGGKISPLEANGEAVPFIGPNGQPVQGFSAVLPGVKADNYWVLVDNGYGGKANSPDSLLRFYSIEADFKTGQVYPADVQTGARLASFTDRSYVQLNDKNGKLKGFQTIVAERDIYPGSELLKPGGIPVDPSIKQNRLLTGADFDPESFRRSADGTLWLGEEFGPFLLHVGADGTLLEAPIATPNPLAAKSVTNPPLTSPSATNPPVTNPPVTNPPTTNPPVTNAAFVRSPDHPDFATLPEADKIKSANLSRSKGFEGMALSRDRTKLYPLLEGTISGDSNTSRLVISEFDLSRKQYTGKTYAYRLDAPTQAIGDMTAINDHEFIVIERDSGTGNASDPSFKNPARSKKLYKIDINQIDPDGFVQKVLLADLLNIADPQGLGGNGTKNGVFTFPFVTIEDVLPIDRQTILVANDNNYPFSIGRTPGKIDNSELIKIKLAQPLNLKTAFAQGVAAGDVNSSRVILWTRTSNPITQQGLASTLIAEIATDPGFKSGIKTFKGSTNATRDYTLKLEATGLASGKKYYYRFKTETGDLSPVGSFTTAPAPNAKVAVKFGFSGDTDGKWRPYRLLQNFSQHNLDYFIFLGDTIYETATDRSPAAADPFANPAQAQADYQRKYRENLEATNAGGCLGTQTLYQSQGNYILLDNHELGNKQFINGGAPTGTPSGKGVDATVIANDVNKTGSFINQTPGFQALLQAYNNYQPIRESKVVAPNDPRSHGTQKLYDAQQWSAHSILINVDDRSYRDIRLKSADGTDDNGPRADHPDRTMLGKTQLQWLKQTLLTAQQNGTLWKFIAISSPIDEVGDDSGKSWSGGYRAERNELLQFIANNKINNVVFLSTDDHQNRVNEITYFTDHRNPATRTRLPNAYTIVAGPIGAGGPDNVTDHSFANLQKLTDILTKAQIAKGLDPLGLDPKNPRVHNVEREFDPNANQLRRPVDFFSPDTFNYVTLELTADGKTLTVNNFGINSYAANTFPEPNASNAPRKILSFKIDAVKTNPGSNR